MHLTWQELIRDFSHLACKEILDESVNFVFIDGAHQKEYVLKDKSWTINYHNTYSKYLSYIKFNNLSNITEENINTCDICKNHFDNTDIVFNMDNIFVHFTCLFSLLIRK